MNSPLTFTVFCDLLERIQKSKKNSDKDSLLLEYIKKYKQTSNKPTFYPALRLLVPEFERERGPYGLKETALAKLFINALCLDGLSASKLTNYRAGTNSRNDNDFAGVTYWVIKRSCLEKSSLTIDDVNAHLDTLALQHAEHKPTREIQRTIYRLTKCATAIEMKWIIRIILKDMKLGMGNNRILKIFHEDAPDLYDVCSNLSKICEDLNDSSKRLHELEISVFTPFRPMLSLKCDSKVFENEVTDKRLFYIENKFDGERFQLHMKDDNYKYYSKNGYEYSNFGNTYDSDGLITPYLKDMFKNVSSIILDGEMMGWNKKTRSFGSKGMNYDVKNLKADSVHRPCYCVFDVVLFNDKILTNQSLKERLKILNDVIFDIDGVIMKSRIIEANTKEEILRELNKSTDKKDEGICFKDPDSIYKPNNRKAGWWKLKLEYFDGLMTELDVLIIGGCYGEGKRRGLISSFLLAVAKDPENAGESPKEFYSFAKVASGFTIDELNQVINKLKPYWKEVNKNENPEGILWKKVKPDVWIEPRNSIILQIKASELTRSKEFQTDYTLRFPRVEKIRYDKPWYTCMTVSELKELTSSCKPVQKLSDKHITINDIEDVPKKRRKKNPNDIVIPTLGEGQLKSNLFKDKEICILTGNDMYTVENLEMKVLENGGNLAKIPNKNTFCAVVGEITTSVNIQKKNNPVDFVTLDWFLKAIDYDKQNILEWTPGDLLNMSQKTKNNFFYKYDKYGDSFTEPISKEKLVNTLKRFDGKDDYMNLIPQEMTNIDKLLNFQNPLGIFRMCFAYFENNEKLSDVKNDFKFFGGKICKTIESYTTHIIFHSSDSHRIEYMELQYTNYDNIKLVSEKWILESISEGKN